MFPSDILTIASKLVKITNEQTITLSTAESCTGGLIAGAITEIPGSSSIFHRGYVTYSNLAKQQVLNVQSYQLKKFGAVSEEVASQMAIGAKLNSNSDISVAVTGIAGPSGGSGEKPIGTVFIALAFKEDIKVKGFLFEGDRAQIRMSTVRSALDIILKEIDTGN